MSFGEDFGGAFAKVIWDRSTKQLGENIRTGPAKVHKAAVITAHRMAPEVESYMKTNAPWTDRTGNARNGLAARAYESGDEVGIVLYHQVSYGIWLEVRWSGKYAIINPTIDVMGPKVMQSFEGLLDRI
jgi:hypothetical protein